MRACSLPMLMMALLWLAPLGATDAVGQTPWLEPVPDRSLYLEVFKPSVEQPFAFTFVTSTWFLTGRFALSDDWSAVAEIPFALAELEPSESISPFLPAESELESQLGNIYLGLDWRPSEGGSFEFGFRLPIVDTARVVSNIAGLTVLVDRAEAFLDDILPVQAAASYTTSWDSGIHLRLRGSPVADIDLDHFSGTQIYFLTLAQLWLARDAFAAGLGLSDRLHINGIGEDFAGITQHHLALFGSYELGRARPGLQFRLPLDKDVRDVIDFVVAATIAVDLH